MHLCWMILLIYISRIHASVPFIRGPERGNLISGPWTTAKITIVNKYIFLNRFKGITIVN